jgi:NAD(P)-dependent dehydrogenase (short-subunit alcohol dehydrogenase family)
MTKQIARHALVFGAAKGIGEAIADALWADGHVVSMLDVDRAAIEARALSAGTRMSAYECDIADRRAVLDAIAKAAADNGPPSVLVVNAMWIRYQPVETLDEQTLDRMLAVGIKGLFWSVQGLLEHYAPGVGASIVTLGSPSARLGFRTASAYTAAKGAVEALTRQFATELGHRNIRVNAVAPGPVRTPGTDFLAEDGWRKRIERTPAGRLGAPGEIAETVRFLASPASQFINGQTISVDGGFATSGP